LKEAPKEPAKLEVLDAQGKVIRALTSEQKKTAEAPDEGERDNPPESIPAAVGLNRFAWDLHYEPPVKFPLRSMTAATIRPVRRRCPENIPCA